MLFNIMTKCQRCADIITNLVATYNQAASFEQTTFVEVSRARSGLADARNELKSAVEGGGSPEALGRADAQLAENLRLFLNVAVEAYPELRANQNFIALQDELSSTENRIAVARRDYNESVRLYNTYIRHFPAVLTARGIGAERQATFGPPAGTEAAPRAEPCGPGTS